MTFEDAIRDSIRAYFKDSWTSKLSEVEKKQKYDKKYFERFEQEKFGSVYKVEV